MYNSRNGVIKTTSQDIFDIGGNHMEDGEEWDNYTNEGGGSCVILLH